MRPDCVAVGVVRLLCLESDWCVLLHIIPCFIHMVLVWLVCMTLKTCPNQHVEALRYLASPQSRTAAKAISLGSPHLHRNIILIMKSCSWIQWSSDIYMFSAYATYTIWKKSTHPSTKCLVWGKVVSFVFRGIVEVCDVLYETETVSLTILLTVEVTTRTGEWILS